MNETLIKKLKLILTSDYLEKEIGLRPAFSDNCNTGHIKGNICTIWVYELPSSLDELHNWAFSVDFLEFLSDEGVEHIVIAEIERAVVIVTTLLEFQKNGVPHLHTEYGLRMTLPKPFWKIIYLHPSDECSRLDNARPCSANCRPGRTSEKSPR